MCTPSKRNLISYFMKELQQLFSLFIKLSIKEDKGKNKKFRIYFEYL